MSREKNKNISTFEEYKDLTIEAVGDFNEKDYNKALPKFEELVKVNNKNTKLHELLAYLYLKKGDVESAEREFQALIELEREKNPDIWKPKSFEELVSEAGDLAEMEEKYNSLFEKNDFDPFESLEIPAKLSLLYMNRGEYEKAEEVLIRFRDEVLNKSAAA